MAKNDSNSGCGCLIAIIVVCVFAFNKCDSRTGDSVNDRGDSIDTETPYNASDLYRTSTSGVSVREYDEFKNNHLSTGAHPYSNEISINGSSSRINVRTSSGGGDVIAILKKSGYMVKNTYIRAGSSAGFDLPNGTYQIFFYSGNGWNPNKQMANGLTGGFVSNEHFSKDEPQTLNNQILEYELIMQQNGNFMTRASSESEVFN